MRTKTTLIAALMIGAMATPAAAQLGGLGKRIDQAKAVKGAIDDLNFTDEEEQELGSQISGMIRDKYGVVQDKAVHKYVALVGNAVALKSSRPGLKWTFVVLDTDGVNAFAAPGGFVHITRGALAIIQNEAELAEVLAHELTHVTEKNTIRAIQKSKGVSAGAKLTRKEFIGKIAEQGYGLVIENHFDRSDESLADKTALTLADSRGYAPTALSGFLQRLADRNKGLTEPSGVFASHPETLARLDAMKKVISGQKLTATATVAGRYTATITYKPIPVTAVAQAAPSGGGFGKIQAAGGDKSSSQSVSSGGARGLNPDRDAKGGPVKTIVVTTVTAAELDAFLKGITG